MSVIDTIKSHPVYIIGAIGVVFVGYIYFSSGSGTPASADASAGDIYAAQNAAAAQLQSQQLAADVQNNGIAAQLQGQQIAAQNTLDVTGIQADVAKTQINAGQEVTDLANTLTANVAMKNIQAGTDVAAINANAQVLTTQTVAGALVQQSALNNATSQAAIAAASACHGIGCWF